VDRARLETLIQAQLDGELPPAERAELARVLLQDASARRLQEDYVQADRLLRAIPAAEPPPELRAAILGGTGQAPSRVAGRPASRPIYRMAAAFLGALVIAGLAYVAGYGRGTGADLQGSLGGAVGAVSLQSEGIAVEASLRREARLYRLALRASTPRPCEVVIRFDPATTSYAGISDGASASVLPGEVTVRLPAGRPAATLEFSGASPATLELRANGRALGEARLPLSLP
jgi:hypothetical protein